MLATALAGCGETGERVAAPPQGRLPETIANDQALTFVSAERQVQLPGKSGTTPAWLYTEKPYPVLRVAPGKPVNVTLVNKLKEHTSIHWHGIRLRNSMDGVPYLTQRPVQPGQRFQYTFTPPDPGTYFFHPHCNTAEQLGRGLFGVLIVDDTGSVLFDDDVLLVMKDWRVADDGSLLPFFTLDGASRAGTFGTLRTVNGVASPEIIVPTKADVRVRLVNADSTRVAEIGVEGANAFVIAIDGQSVSPFALEGWRLGPGMRADLLMRTPEAGGKATVVDYFAREPVTLATLTTKGAETRFIAFAPHGLRAPRLIEPDLGGAERHQLKLSASAVATDYADIPPIRMPDGTTINLLDTLCTNGRTLWAIDGKPWPQNGHEHVPPSLMNFRRGESVVIEFVNTTPHVHPMHLHGHSFKVLSATKFKRPVHWADTVLVMPDERVEIAFVADNPGNWMIHCHIIEHQDTGMMGWFRVA